MTAVEQHHHNLKHFIIKDEQGKNYSIEEFLDKIKTLKVRIQKQMGKININQIDRYEENHRPFKKTRRNKRKKQHNETPQENKSKYR